MSSDSDIFGDGDQPMQDISDEVEHVEDVGDRQPIPQINFPPGSEPSGSDTGPSIWQDLSSVAESALARRVRQLADQIDVGEELLRQILLWEVHRAVVDVRSWYLFMKDDTNEYQPVLNVSDIELTVERLNLYLLWLYTYDYPLVTRWRDQLWPDDLEGALEVLLLASYVNRREDHDQEHNLLPKSQQTLREIFPTKLMILAESELSVYHRQARGSIERCLEILFKQQAKDEYFKKLRTQIMMDIFLNADALLPKHKWLNKWNGRSPAFKAQFKLTRKELLKEQQIQRRAQPTDDEDVEERDERCEAFEDTILATQALEPLHHSLSAPHPGLLPPVPSAVPSQPNLLPPEPDRLHPRWQPCALSPLPQAGPSQLRRRPALRQGKRVTAKEERESYTDELETDPLIKFPAASGVTEDDPAANLGHRVWRDAVRRRNDPTYVPESVKDARDTDSDVQEAFKTAVDTDPEDDFILDAGESIDINAEEELFWKQTGLDLP